MPLKRELIERSSLLDLALFLLGSTALAEDRERLAILQLGAGADASLWCSRQLRVAIPKSPTHSAGRHNDAQFHLFVRRNFSVV